MNRARSEEKRAQALNDYLNKIGLDMAEYLELMAQAERPWYRLATGEIVVPAHQLYGCLVEAADRVSSSLRPCATGSIRHMIRLSDFPTGLSRETGIYKRLVMPKSGTGQPLSNQRSLRSDPFIAAFSATGSLSYDPDTIAHANDLRTFIEWAGANCGVGAARKMGVGRFVVQSWVERDATISEALREIEMAIA